MTDTELLDEFTKAQRSEIGVAIRVCRITWPHPHKPKSRWETAFMLSANSNDQEIHLARMKLLKEKNYFGVCSECHERKPKGWMHEDGLCQACASDNHDVVY
jgi:hypothetical protein